MVLHYPHMESHLIVTSCDNPLNQDALEARTNILAEAAIDLLELIQWKYHSLMIAEYLPATKETGACFRLSRRAHYDEHDLSKAKGFTDTITPALLRKWYELGLKPDDLTGLHFDSNDIPTL